MNATPNVFIMSSNTGYNLALALKEILSRNRRIDVRTWKSGDFRSGESFLDTLHRTTLIYDFGINLLTPDDMTQVRGETKMEPRDNVSFELGLFLGARGSRRAFAVLVSVGKTQPSIPTDLQGVKHPMLSVEQLNATVEKLVPQIEQDVEALAAEILKGYKEPQITILPSTGLAIGYFHNFILPVMKGLRTHQKVSLTVGETQSEKPVNIGAVTLTVCIPENLGHATRELWSDKAKVLKLAQGEVKPGNDPDLPRPYPFRVNANVADGLLKIYDTPTTLLTAQHVVRRLLPESKHLQEDRSLAEESEIHNFERTLRTLLKEPDSQWFEKQILFARWSKL